MKANNRQVIDPINSETAMGIKMNAQETGKSEYLKAVDE